MRKALGEGGERAPCFVGAAGAGERANAQRLALLGQTPVREPAPVLRHQHQRVSEVSDCARWSSSSSAAYDSWGVIDRWGRWVLPLGASSGD